VEKEGVLRILVVSGGGKIIFPCLQQGIMSIGEEDRKI